MTTLKSGEVAVAGAVTRRMTCGQCGASGAAKGLADDEKLATATLSSQNLAGPWGESDVGAESCDQNQCQTVVSWESEISSAVHSFLI